MGTECDGLCSQHSGQDEKINNLKEEVYYLHSSNKELRAGQALINKAIVKMTTNMETLGRIEARVLNLEGRIGKVIGGLVLASVVVPMLVTALATVSVVYLNKPSHEPPVNHIEKNIDKNEEVKEDVRDSK